MKGLIKFAFLAIIIFVAKNYYDNRYEGKIVGTWDMVTAYLEGNAKAVIEYKQVYTEDGSARAEGKITFSISNKFVASASFETESSWEVNKNKLLEIPISMKIGKYRGDSNFFPAFDFMRDEAKREIGNTLQLEILMLKNDAMRIRDSDSNEYIGTKLN